MRILAIRHLPTSYNKKNLFQGRRDISIITPGVEEIAIIRRNIEFLKKYKIEEVYTSTLARTQETAELYGYTSYTIAPLLDELDFGEYEGINRDTLIVQKSDLWKNRPHELIFGETIADFSGRIRSFLSKVSNYSNVLLFGHGAWLRALTAISQGDSVNNFNHYNVPNNYLTEFIIESTDY